MNSPILAQNFQNTMSSREIAELCDKQHFHVKRDIEVMANQLKLDVTKFGAIYFDNQNRQQVEYLLDKDLTLTLVAGYNATLRYRIIQRWQALESQAFQPAQLSRMDILQLAMQAEQENQALKQQIAVIEPQAHALQRITQQGEDLCFRECAKVLKVAPSYLIDFLISNGWIYRDAKSKPQAYQTILTKGYLIHHYSSPQLTLQGERIFAQVKVTAKGVAKLAQLLQGAK
ncbi:phage antirepressor KilAC domain-containing protein [Acinetobacter sp. c3-l95]|uniref:phage antirepressor KilAC domain-containing protein n=1 Tax=Acinetobacter sp. c3-l95 TaxID=3342804 RepID=UPI0035B996DD